MAEDTLTIMKLLFSYEREEIAEAEKALSSTRAEYVEKIYGQMEKTELAFVRDGDGSTAEGRLAMLRRVWGWIATIRATYDAELRLADRQQESSRPTIH